MILFSVGYLFNVTTVEFPVFLLLGGMPIAIAAFILSDELNVEEELVSNSVAVSTLLSLITIIISIVNRR